MKVTRCRRVNHSALTFFQQCLAALLFLVLFVIPIACFAQEEQPPQAPPAEEAPPALSAPSAPGLVNVIFNQGKIETALQAIAQQTGVSIVARGKVPGQRVDLIAQDEPLESVLDRLVASKPDWVWYKVDETHYEIMDKRTYEETILPKQVKRKVFMPRYIKAEDVEKAISNVLTKGIGSVAVDQRTNKLIVTDLPQVIELISRILEELDVQNVTRVFYIKYADVNFIADKLQNYKSAPGLIEVDPKSHQIIVTDTFQNIKRMELLIQVLDKGPEMRVYDINNIGLKGVDVKELQTAIERVITPDAYWELNYKAGKLIVEDVPEVHEKIEKILSAFDQPSKQVLIQVEVIETSFDRAFNLGVEYDLSRDLPSARKDALFGFTVPNKDAIDYGFTNLREEFPTASLPYDTGQLTISYLSKHMRAKLLASLADTDTKVLIQPRLLVKNHEKALIRVGGEVPYLTTYYYAGQTTTDRSTSQNYVREGLSVEIEPSIANNKLVELNITVENDTADKYTAKYADQSYDLVSKTTQEAQTTLIIPSGETRVLGGFVRSSDSDIRKGIPVLCKIPYLGPLLFGSTDQSKKRRDILFFITPFLVEERGVAPEKTTGVLLGPEEALAAEELETSPTVELARETSPSLTRRPAEPTVVLSAERPRDLPRVSALEPSVLTKPIGRTSSYEPSPLGPAGAVGTAVVPTTARPYVPTAARPGVTEEVEKKKAEEAGAAQPATPEGDRTRLPKPPRAFVPEGLETQY
jgi:type II secretory pathway component GspD/PulD (secretin)